MLTPTPTEISGRFEEKLAKELDEYKKKVDERAKFKIEISYGKDRSMSSLKPSVGILTVWESHTDTSGDGDELMTFCGHCNRPIGFDTRIMVSIMCPYCNKESFLSEGDKAEHIAKAPSVEGANIGDLKKMPCCATEKLFRMSPPNLAKFIEKIWLSLGGNADIYLKYHPSEIRYRTADMTPSQISKKLDKARSRRQIAIYPLNRQLKDMSAGATPWKRFLAFLLS